MTMQICSSQRDFDRVCQELETLGSSGRTHLTFSEEGGVTFPVVEKRSHCRPSLLDLRLSRVTHDVALAEGMLQFFEANRMYVLSCPRILAKCAVLAGGDDRLLKKFTELFRQASQEKAETRRARYQKKYDEEVEKLRFQIHRQQRLLKKLKVEAKSLRDTVIFCKDKKRLTTHSQILKGFLCLKKS